MNFQEFEQLKASDPHRLIHYIHVSEVDGPDRTLIYGYTIERDTFHVYKKDGEIHIFTYSLSGDIDNLKSGKMIAAMECVPDKRVYPESCDKAFCDLLMMKGVNIPYTSWDGERFQRLTGVVFHGKIGK